MVPTFLIQIVRRSHPTGKVRLFIPILAVLALTPLGTIRGQVTIHEEIAIRPKRVPAYLGTDNLKGGLTPAAVPTGFHSGKTTRPQSTLNCDPGNPFQSTNYAPCKDVIFGYRFGCGQCTEQTCGTSGTIHLSMSNLVTSETTFTFKDGSTDPVVAPVYLEPDGFLGTADPFEWTNETWWGVMTVSYVVLDAAADSLCWWSGEWPVDSDDDFMSDDWEMLEENGITLDMNLSKPSTDASCLALGDKDGCWDEEEISVGLPPAKRTAAQNGEPSTGDGITKYDEYRGFEIGGVHSRLTTGLPELFVDYGNSSHGEWAVGVVGALAEIDFIPVSGFKYKNIEILGTNQLIFIRDLQPGEPLHYVRIRDAYIDVEALWSRGLIECPDWTLGVQAHYGDGLVLEDDIYNAIGQPDSVAIWYGDAFQY